MERISASSTASSRTRVWILSSIVGLTLALVSLVPYIVPEERVSSYLAVPLAALSIFSMPGMIASLYLSGSAHDPKPVLAAIVNALIYGAITFWIMGRKKRAQ